MKYYKEHIKKWWYCFILGPLFMVLEACGEFILPYMSANMINIGAANKDVDYIIRYGIYMALIAAAMLLTGVLGALYSIKGSSNLAAGIRRDVFGRIQKFSFSNIDSFTTGSLITRITNDVTQIQNFSQTLLRGMFRSPVMLVGALIMSFVLEPSLALIILVVMPILALSIALIIKTASPRYTRMQKQLDTLNTDVSENVSNQRVIKSFVREDYEEEKFSKINNELANKNISALKMMLLLQPISALAINVTTILVVWNAGRTVMVGGMEIGTLTAFITYLSQVLTALNFLANIVLQGTRAAASHRRIKEVFSAEIDIESEGNEKNIESADIEFKNVSFKYFKTSSEKALDNISFSIREGETVGIIGSTGSGKSTLISLIARLYDADEGEILIGGKNIKSYDLDELRRIIALVLQKNTLFSGTVLENLSWAGEENDMESVKKACDISCAREFVEAFENGYDTEIERGGANLSGGQKQRLCIARALLKNPRILILDDSTSAVDTATESKIRQGLRENFNGITKIIIAQRITSVWEADKIIVMDEGKISGIGTHSNLLKSCKIYEEIFSSQMEKEEKNA